MALINKIILIVIIILFVGFLISNNLYINYDKIEKNKFTNCRVQCSSSVNWEIYHKEKIIENCENDVCFCECKASFYSSKIYPLLKIN